MQSYINIAAEWGVGCVLSSSTIMHAVSQTASHVRSTVSILVACMLIVCAMEVIMNTACRRDFCNSSHEVNNILTVTCLLAHLYHHCLYVSLRGGHSHE